MKSTIGVGVKPMIINQYQIKTKGEDKMKEKQGYKIVDIKWDTDGDKALFDSLPQEIILPEWIPYPENSIAQRMADDAV